jgi:hypothetical protein
MANRKQKDMERLAAEMMSGTAKVIGKMYDELYANGTIEKWKMEKKLKETERIIRKTERKLREQRIIDECLEEERKARKSA